MALRQDSVRGTIGQTWQKESSVHGVRNMSTQAEILTLDEVAEYLKAGKRTVYRLAQKGGIPGFKLGGTWRFRRIELDDWIAARINEAKPGAR